MCQQSATVPRTFQPPNHSYTPNFTNNAVRTFHTETPSYKRYLKTNAVMEPMIRSQSVPQQTATLNPTPIPYHYPQSSFDTLLATDSHSVTSNQNQTTHSGHKTAQPSTSPPHLLSPFKFQPPIPQPSILPNPRTMQQPNYSTWHPIEILHTFNLLHSIPAMPASHHMVLELHQQPLEPQVQLEHELRIINIEAWWRRGGKAAPMERTEEPWKAYRFEKNEFDMYQQQEPSEASLEGDRKPQGWTKSRRGSVTGGNGHVAGGKVVKPSATPRSLLGQIPAKASLASYKVMGRERT
ncbi:MAG: hypothetical protein Q9226_001118 [Calogaya cf. arnoldii]